MKKNIDPKTAQLFEATKKAFNTSFSTVIRPKGVYKVCPSDIENIGHNINLRKRIAEAEKAVEETNEYCLKKRAKERLQSLKRLKFRDVSGFIVDDNIDWSAVVDIMDGYSCGLASLPRIMRELATMCGEKVFLEAAPVEDGTEAAEVETVTEAAPAEARKFRLYYINHSDKAVSRVVELIKADVEGSPLPVWIECREDDYGRKYGRTCYQLTDSICFRANAGYISEEYISPLTGGELSDWHKEHIDMFNNGMSNIKAEIIATPAAQLNGTMWPNLAVVNAYTAAGMATEAAYLIAARERITKEREERRKTQEEEARRREEERRRQEAEEKARRIAEAIKKFMEKGEITGEDVVLLCDEEGIRINPRTRHNLLEVVTYFENNGNRAHYKTYGKRKPSLDGCFTVADSLYQLLKIKADEAENAAPAAPDFAEVLAADAAAMPLALPAITESAIIEHAERIKAIYEDMKAEADSQPAGMSCDDLPDTTPIYTAADVEKMIEEATADTYTAEEVAAMVAAAVAEERARHTRRRFAPRLRPVLRRLGRVAAVVLPLLIVVLFMGASTDAAPATDAETVAQVIDLPSVTVTAEAVTDAPATPSPVKKLAAPSTVKNVADAAECSSQKTDTADTPAGEKTASPMNTDSDPHGLTICEGTPWAYTMMNWA